MSLYCPHTVHTFHTHTYTHTYAHTRGVMGTYTIGPSATTFKEKIKLDPYLNLYLTVDFSP